MQLHFYASGQKVHVQQDSTSTPTQMVWFLSGDDSHLLGDSHLGFILVFPTMLLGGAVVNSLE